MLNSYTLGQHFEAFVQAQLASGRYSDASEVVRDALRLMEERERCLAAVDIAIERVRSLNPRWNEDEIHARIAGLAAIQKGGRVLDLGCGAGPTLPHLLAAVGTSGEVVAVNRRTNGFAAIGKRYPEPIATGRLRLVELDIAAPLPFASASFDSLVCQNVIDCISDREALLAEMHRILRPGGVAVISHCDWDGILLASEDRELTRRMISGDAYWTDDWRNASEGQMGRLLPGLVARSPFSEAATETVLFVDLSMSEDSFAKD